MSKTAQPQVDTGVAPPQVATEPDITQRTTNTNPTTFPKQKDPKAVARGKASALKRQQGREAQEKAFEEAIEEKNELKAQTMNTTQPSPSPIVEPPAEPRSTSSGVAQTTRQEAPANNSSSISTAGWISIVGMGVMLLTAYVKREDLNAVKDYFTGGGGRKRSAPVAARRAPAAPAAKQEPPAQPRNNLRPML